MVNETINRVQAVGVEFQENMLILKLSDGRQVWLPMHKIQWLDRLCNASPEQRTKCEILPQGYGVYWQELDDGFELEHALTLNSLKSQEES